MRVIIFLNILFLHFLTHSQSGYFGKRNAIDLTISLAPSARTKATIETQENNIQSRKLRYVYPSFQIGYLHQVLRRMEIGLSYEHASMTSVSGIASYIDDNDETTRILSDINFKKHLIGLHFNFYQNERISPIGKFIGFSFNYGFSTVDKGQNITHGTLDSLANNSSVFNQRTYISSQFTDSIDYLNNRISYFLIRATVGKKFPINNHLSIKSSVSYPIISIYSKFSELDTNPVARLLNFFGASYPLATELELEDGDVRELMRYSNFFYNGIQLKVGLNYYF